MYMLTFKNFLMHLFFFFKLLSTVVSIFTAPCPPALPIPTSYPWTYPLWLCPCVPYTHSLKAFTLLFPIIALPLPLWLLSVCSLFQCLWLYFAVDQKTVVHLHNGVLCHRKKEVTPTLCDSMDGSGEHYLSEISQAVREKYHMISPVSGT